MAPKKKGGKKKRGGQVMDLGAFLSSTGDAMLGTGTKVHQIYEDGDDGYVKQVVLPTAPRSARGPTIDPSTISDVGPFMAKVGNLPFQMGENDVAFFFTGLNIVSFKLEEDPTNSAKMLGYGMIEFASKVDLLEALEKHEDTMRGRKIRVEIPGMGGGREDRWGARPDRGPRDENQGERSQGCDDWRSAPPDATKGPERGTGGGFEDRRGGGGFEDRRGGDRDGRDGGGGFGDRDRTREKSFDRFAGGDKPPTRGGFQGTRDYGERREGGFGDRREGGGFGDRREGGGFGDRREGGGFGDRREGGGFGDRDRRDGGGYGRDGGRDGGYGSRRGGFEDEERSTWRREAPAAPAREEPQERQRLKLAPRTKPLAVEAEGEAKVETSGEEPNRSASIFGDARPVDIEAKMKELAKPKETAPSVVKPKNADLFGAAKPVDTLAREKEIEEKLAKMKLDEKASKHKEEPAKGADSWRDRPKNDDRSRNEGGRGSMEGERRRNDYNRRDERSGDRNRDFGRNDRDRNDNRNYERRDNRSYDRRDDRNDNRRDDRGYQRRDDRGDIRRDDRDRDNNGRSSSRDRENNGRKEVQKEKKQKPPKEKPEGYDSDEERFRKAQPKKKGANSGLDVKNYSAMDLEVELA